MHLMHEMELTLVSGLQNDQLNSTFANVSMTSQLSGTNDLCMGGFSGSMTMMMMMSSGLARSLTGDSQSNHETMVSK